MKLYHYWRSSTSYRARIGLALKNVAYEKIPIDLTKAEHRMPDYSAINPQHGVPTLELPDGTRLTQSLAILAYLDEMYPEPPLFPPGADAARRAHCRAVALNIACDTHAYLNLRTLNYLRQHYGQDDAGVKQWAVHWNHEGLDSSEKLIAHEAGPWAFGAAPSIADICLVPQTYNAHVRFGMSLDPYPRLKGIWEAAGAHPAFQAAAPEAQAEAR